MLISTSRDWEPRNLLLPVDSNAGAPCLVFKKISGLLLRLGRELRGVPDNEC